MFRVRSFLIKNQPNNKKIIKQVISRHFSITKCLTLEIEAKPEEYVTSDCDKIPGIRDGKNQIKYTTIDRKSSILTNFMVSVKSKSKREKSKLMLLEGKRLIQDGIDAGMQPLAVFFSRPADITNFALNPKVNLYRMPYKNLQFWSELSTTQGIMAIFSIPDIVNFGRASNFPLTIICDNVRDPGNMGSILRTAAAVGCSQVLLTKGCVDLWGSKVLRAAAGAHFRLNIQYSILWTEIKNFLPNDSQLFLADSETHDPTTTTEYYEINNGEKFLVNEESKRITSFQNREDSGLPLIPYTTANYANAAALVLILGGETEGLSKDAYHLGTEKQGTRIYVPMSNGVESLNSGTALGILAYEIRRQCFS